ncbi:hypothetical protein DPEC_G00269470 [Dallia pectoralis]|uniref:Uncharacterized protein n=1 Tax=Dallia pectoralis TaxID=75939 RepID=A0ACC2FPC9_DALPE|nr:hypothetical protein DPEC_G00269470 [Dallia pectoralis]
MSNVVGLGALVDFVVGNAVRLAAERGETEEGLLVNWISRYFPRFISRFALAVVWLHSFVRLFCLPGVRRLTPGSRVGLGAQTAQTERARSCMEDHSRARGGRNDHTQTQYQPLVQ